MSPASGRPRVVLNCAASADGRLAYADGRPALLSGPEDLARVHRLRANSQAILVGVTTVLRDDPSLRVKWEVLGEPARSGPTRVVLDSRARTPASARVLDGSQPTIVATTDAAPSAFRPPVVQFRAGIDRVDLPRLLGFLAEHGVRQLMVEGGASVLASFLRGGWVDEWTLYVAPVVIGGASAPALVAGPESHDGSEALGLVRVSARPLGEGTLVTYRLRPAVGEPLSAGPAPSRTKGPP